MRVRERKRLSMAEQIFPAAHRAHESRWMFLKELPPVENLCARADFPDRIAACGEAHTTAEKTCEEEGETK